MARTNMNLPNDVDREMRHEAVDLGLRYPGEFVQFLWKQYKKYKEEEKNMRKIRIYWSEEDLRLDPWDVPDVMKSVVAEIEEQGIEIGLWNDGENIGISWSLEVSDVPKTLSREFEEIEE